MTLEERFASSIVVEKIDNDYVCELWGASTKHPASNYPDTLLLRPETDMKNECRHLQSPHQKFSD